MEMMILYILRLYATLPSLLNLYKLVKDGSESTNIMFD